MSESNTYEIEVAGVADGGDRVPDLSPKDAFDRWLAKLRVSKSDETVSAYHYRLKHFVGWCQENRILSISEITGWDIETYETYRREQGLEPITLNNELGTLKNFFEYLARIEMVDESLPERVEPPTVPRSEQVSKTRLRPDDARALLDYYEADPDAYGTRAHALLALAWYTGARLGGLRALDVDDYSSDDQYVAFVNREDQGTRLKNGLDGERIVALPPSVCDVVDEYLRHHRLDIFDDCGRRPLLASQQGRPTPNGVRGWMYRATVPCIHSPCPHGKDPETCEWLDYATASQCPSSRSPHQVRTGSITWQLNRGVPIDRVAERVNTSVEVLQRHYDQQSQLDEMEERRRRYVDQLSFDDGEAVDE